ncbi:MAG TPA: division/cell wall cluster transcriptional repressor MraZ [Dehalococcoidia bacterium]|jgi:MraZ protein|nr:division/cell wall cluster transcriptional repressor MraZ [Dehalococcoidia bacterium]
MAAFLGEFEYNIDSKGRLPIPPRFREEFRAGGVACFGLDKCIVVYPMSEWTKRAEALSKLPEMRSKDRRLSRFLFSGAFPFVLDANGRLALPGVLRQYAELKNTAIIAGLYHCLEIWSRELWDQEMAEVRAQAAQLWERLERRE